MVEDLISDEGGSLICGRCMRLAFGAAFGVIEAIDQKGADILLTTFKRPRRSPYWVKECWKPAFSPSRFRYPIHVLARKGFVGDVPESPTPRNFSRKTGRSKTSRFHFKVKLFLPNGIFTQNIFSTF